MFFGHEGMAWSSQLLIQLLPMPAFMCCRDVDFWIQDVHMQVCIRTWRDTLSLSLNRCWQNASKSRWCRNCSDANLVIVKCLGIPRIWWTVLVRFQSLLAVKRKSTHAFNFNTPFQSVTFCCYWETNWFFTQFIINLKGSYAMIWEISGSILLRILDPFFFTPNPVDVHRPYRWLVVVSSSSLLRTHERVVSTQL